MDNIAANLEKQYPDSNAGNRVRLRPLLEIFVSDVRSALWVLFGAVAFVLLIACANIANLLLARATARQKEMAIRSAMGAGRWRIARQLLTESVLLSIVGGILGLLIARWCIDLILYISPDAIPRSREIGLDWRVLAFTIGVSFLTGILFGLVPALQAGVVDVHETLKETGRGTTRRHWLRSSLVVVEVASTLVLLIGAGLMIRSFYRLQKVNPGFSYARLASFTVSLPQKKYVTEEQRTAFFKRLLENISGLARCGSIGGRFRIAAGQQRLANVVSGRWPAKTAPRSNAVDGSLHRNTRLLSCDGHSAVARSIFHRSGQSIFSGRTDLSKLDEGERARSRSQLHHR